MDVNLITAVSAAAGAVLSGVATTIAIIVAYKVHQNQKPYFLNGNYSFLCGTTWQR